MPLFFWCHVSQSSLSSPFSSPQINGRKKGGREKEEGRDKKRRR
jgi:hypothetical protein